jgi:hypothetical protein
LAVIAQKQLTLAARTLAMQFEQLLVGPFNEYPVAMLPLSPRFTSQRASSISREAVDCSTRVLSGEPNKACDTSSVDPPSNMGKYMEMLVAIAFIIGGIVVMVCAVLWLVSDLVRQPHALSSNGDDD